MFESVVCEAEAILFRPQWVKLGADALEDYTGNIRHSHLQHFESLRQKKRESIVNALELSYVYFV